MSIETEKPRAATRGFSETLSADAVETSPKCQQQFDTALGHSSTTHSIRRQIGTTKDFAALPANDPSIKFVSVPENVAALFRAAGKETALSVWVFLQESGRLTFSTGKTRAGYVASNRGWTLPELANAYSVGRAKPVDKGWISKRLEEIKAITGLTYEQAHDPLTGRPSGRDYYPHLMRSGANKYLDPIETVTPSVSAITATVSPPNETANPACFTFTAQGAGVVTSPPQTYEQTTEPIDTARVFRGRRSQKIGDNLGKLDLSIVQIPVVSTKTVSPEVVQSYTENVSESTLTTSDNLSHLSPRQAEIIIDKLGDETKPNARRNLYFEALGITSYSQLTKGSSGTGSELVGALFGNRDGESLNRKVEELKQEKEYEASRQRQKQIELMLEKARAERVKVKASSLIDRLKDASNA
jgi:hypothetical protein